MVDTGASISILPRHLADHLEPKIEEDHIRLQGLVGRIEASGYVTLPIPLPVPYNPPAKMWIAELEQNFAIIGMDFLKGRNLTIDLDSPAMEQVHQGKTYRVPLLTGKNRKPGREWKEMLEEQARENQKLRKENNRKAKAREADKTKIPLSECKCETVIDRYPGLLEEPDYKKPRKHSKILDVQSINPELPVAPFRSYKKKLNHYERDLLRTKLKEMTDKGILEKVATLTYSSPITLRKKKSGEMRICVNYKVFNSLTQDLYFPLPNPQSLTEEIKAQHVIFSTVDLKSAYYSLPLSERAANLCGIVVDGLGSYKPRVTMFGMKQAPSKFQELAEEVIEGLESFCFVYLDDFLIYSKSEEEHRLHLDRLFERLDKWGLYVNREKCTFGVSELTYLGYTIGRNGISPKENPMGSLQEMKPPKDVKKLRSFLGAIGYYRRFIPHLAETLEPLYKLLQGRKPGSKAKIELSEKEEKARQAAIQALGKAVELQYEDPELPMVITSDASKSHMGGVLEQFASQKDRTTTRPLAFFSSRLPPSVKERSAFNAELTALHRTMRHFKERIRHRPLIIRTDHKALVNALQNVTGDHSPVEDRMLVYIKEYNPIEVLHIEGSQNIVADMLSRPPDEEEEKLEITKWKEGGEAQITLVEEEEEEVGTTIDPKLFETRKGEIAEEMRTHVFEEGMSQSHKKAGDTTLQGVTYKCTPGSFSVWVPKSLRPYVWSAIHRTIHQGVETTLENIRKAYYWPGMKQDVDEWTRCCPQCQEQKVVRYQKTALKNFPGNEGRMEIIHVDTVGPLTESEGFKYLLTCKDRGTGFLVACPIRDKTAREVATNFERTFIAVFGPPAIIVSDNGTEFVNAIFRQLLKKNGIQHRRTTPYHPQANGLVERCHRELRRCVRILEQPEQWVQHLPYWVLQMNNSSSDRNSFSAHQRTFGQAGRIPGHVNFLPEWDSQQVTTENTEVFQELMSHHKKKKRPLKTVEEYIDRRLYLSDFAYVKNENRTCKLKKVWLGPYRILKREEKYFTLLIKGKGKNVSIDRLKSARMMQDSTTTPSRTSDSGDTTTSSETTEVERTARYNLRPKRRTNFKNFAGPLRRAITSSETETDQLFSETYTTHDENSTSEEGETWQKWKTKPWLCRVGRGKGHNKTLDNDGVYQSSREGGNSVVGAKQNKRATDVISSSAATARLCSLDRNESK